MANNLWWIHKTIFTRPTWEIFTGRSIESKTITRNKNIIRGRNDGCDNKQCNGGSGWETQHVANVTQLCCSPMVDNAMQQYQDNTILCCLLSAGEACGVEKLQSGADETNLVAVSQKSFFSSLHAQGSRMWGAGYFFCSFPLKLVPSKFQNLSQIPLKKTEVFFRRVVFETDTTLCRVVLGSAETPMLLKKGCYRKHPSSRVLFRSN